MALFRAVHGRLGNLVREVAKYGIVNGLALVVTIIVDYAYLAVQPDARLTAYIVASVLSTALAYLGNRFWTYRHRDSAGDVREVALYAAINAVAIAMQSGIVALTFYVLNMTSRLEGFFNQFVLAMGIGMVFRFWCYRSFIFPKAAPALASDAFRYSEPLPTFQLVPTSPPSDSKSVFSARSH